MFPEGNSGVIQFLADIAITFRGKRGVAVSVRPDANQAGAGHDANLFPGEKTARLWCGHLVALFQVIEQEKAGAQRHPFQLQRPILLARPQLPILASAHAPVVQVDDQFFQGGTGGTLRPESGKALLGQQLHGIEQPGTGEDGGRHAKSEQVGKGNTVIIFPPIVKGNGNFGVAFGSAGIGQHILKRDDMVVALQQLQQGDEGRLAQHQMGVVAEGLFPGWKDAMKGQNKAAATRYGAPKYRGDPRTFHDGAEDFHIFLHRLFLISCSGICDSPGGVTGNQSTLRANVPNRVEIRRKDAFWGVTPVT